MEHREYTDEFGEWCHGFSEPQQYDITAAGLLLMELGPQVPFSSFVGN